MILEIEHIWIFMLILPLLSFLYASVGHGGASGYLALMSLFSFPYLVMKPTALLLNIFVAGISFYYYYKEEYFNKKLFLYFALASIPMSFLGGTLYIDATLYKKILAILLIFAVLKMLNIFGKESTKIKEIKIWQGIILGSAIGFFSGLIGIGGGIILSPIILLFHWGKMKETAAVSALFIWVNSVAGLSGQISSGVSVSSESFIMVIIALIGGVFGAYFGSKIVNNHTLKYVLAFVLIVASVKLFFI
ncbi:MAG: sulfite exporter TauE/SafE family protein [Flavobacteriaceae bacterium]|nr:sulfite exporter TauE/SafE family protein [Flavobacteriaceae bacterium]